MGLFDVYRSWGARSGRAMSAKEKLESVELSVKTVDHQKKMEQLLEDILVVLQELR
jgi:hypothetical protein